MKKFIKVLVIAVCALLLLAGGFFAWLVLRSPDMRAASTETFDHTPERIERGRYLVNHVSDCVGCHSDRLTTWAMPIKPGTEGQGGFPFDEKFSVPGVVCAQNITPDPEFGLGQWTDGEILRAFREGVNRDGEALFPMMPYQNLRSMSDEDAKSVVSYLRTLPPIHRSVPGRKLDFPVKYLIKFAPKPLDGPVSSPDPADSVAYGGYLVTIAGCAGCHTPMDDHGKRIESMRLAGGWEMRGPWGRVVTANLTPHPETYIGRATREEFIGRFKSFEGMDASNAPVAPPGENTIMPWLVFSGMTEHDLGAIYDYLKTVPPIETHVVKFPDAVKKTASGG